jgi:hypothetical protein
VVAERAHDSGDTGDDVTERLVRPASRRGQLLVLWQFPRIDFDQHRCAVRAVGERNPHQEVVTPHLTSA